MSVGRETAADRPASDGKRTETARERTGNGRASMGNGRTSDGLPGGLVEIADIALRIAYSGGRWGTAGGFRRYGRESDGFG